MRGKLRDKRTETKRDGFKRDLLERRRPVKRDNRNITWLNQEPDEEEDGLLEEEETAVVAVKQKGK
ncbi:MAG TPA: hypothetical protein VNG51_22200 [Ktedonobacteraceae bacterium]|nr:hypothetical protein [Ktedonobacteraceae bacterium]